jgi:hypothetical protein
VVRASYPARFTFDAPAEIDRWRPLVHWLLVIPHLAVVQALERVAQVLAVISWFAILFTGRLPSGIANFQAMYMRYWLRTATYAGFLRQPYPAFSYTASPADPGDDPETRIDLAPRLEDRNRVTTGFRLILVIPHIVVLAVLTVAVVVVGVIGFFAVIFTGRWPQGLRDFAVGVGRWWLRVDAYLLLLTDEYPPFSLDDMPLPILGPS